MPRRHLLPVRIAASLGVGAALVAFRAPEPRVDDIMIPTTPATRVAGALARDGLRGPVARTTGTLRVVTWNIGRNSVVPTRATVRADSRAGAFARVMGALAPDVVCLQELTIGPDGAASLFDRIAPLDGGARWHAVSVLGNVLLSRWPLEARQARTFRQGFSQRGHVIARVALPGGSADTDPTVACMHLQAKGGAANLAFRVRHANAVVRDLSGATGPVLAMGDMNAVDVEKPYISAFPLAVAPATHNASGTDAYTWRNDRSGHAPGLLDYVLFSARHYAVRGAFVLNTMTLADDALAAAGLRRGDALRDARTNEYDHLPVVVDLEPGARAATALR